MEEYVPLGARIIIDQSSNVNFSPKRGRRALNETQGFNVTPGQEYLVVGYSVATGGRPQMLLAHPGILQSDKQGMLYDLSARSAESEFQSAAGVTLAMPSYIVGDLRNVSLEVIRKEIDAAPQWFEQGAIERRGVEGTVKGKAGQEPAVFVLSSVALIRSKVGIEMSVKGTAQRGKGAVKRSYVYDERLQEKLRAPALPVSPPPSSFYVKVLKAG
jgi:hypothetical protein